MGKVFMKIKYYLNYNIQYIMIHRTEVSILLCLTTFMLISRIKSRSSSAVVQDAPLPVSFFSGSDFITDYPFGNIYDIGKLLEKEEILFVMYYAPWCGHSKKARQSFVDAARYMHHQNVQFVGCNCWFPSGSCRQQNDFTNYPLFYLYIYNQPGLKYKGAVDSASMISFIQRLIHPFHYISTRNQLHLLSFQQENTVICHFDLNDEIIFTEFYHASLDVFQQFSNSDHFQIAVILSPTYSAELGIKSNTCIVVRMLHHLKRLQSPVNFTRANVFNWIVQSLQLPFVHKFFPSGLKSSILSQIISPGPSLLVFDSDYPLVGPSNLEIMMKYLALRHRQCDNPMEADMMQNTMLRIVENFNKKLVEMEVKCSNWKDFLSEKVTPLVTRQCCSDINSSCDVCINHSSTSFLGINKCRYFPDAELLKERLLGSCQEFRRGYGLHEHISSCCFPPNDQRKISHNCSLYLLAKKLGFRRNASDHLVSLKQLNTSIDDLKCQLNVTLQFVYMDTRFSSEYLKNLVGNYTLPAAIMFDSKKEVLAVFKDNFTVNNLADFVRSFVSNDIPRHQRSSTISSSCAENAGSLCWTEVNTESFNSVIMNTAKDVVLLHYASYCVHCTVLAHTLLQLQKILRGSGSLLFARINGETNDLPWHHAAYAYPTLQLYPASNKANSVVFPEGVRPDLPHLLNFVLVNCSPSLRIKLLLHMCRFKCVNQNRRRAMREKVKWQKEIFDIYWKLAEIKKLSDVMLNLVKNYQRILNQKLQHAVARYRQARKLHSGLKHSRLTAKVLHDIVFLNM